MHQAMLLRLYIYLGDILSTSFDGKTFMIIYLDAVEFVDRIC